ncbi:hypothetical protein HBH98_099120 [Parastagonospora nodorum]|nr:hypothetical protein HBH53_060960 [Parastagonospora nodorum]KAH3999262.1 hypothetical protein HBI10_119470 [Parastagonospora nodorum]KAH4025125.1 hypothetical protein HBI13_077720 [Parastagonospora nodorum]KAH4346871.1 hypothetical protein HBH98_099120 [Parastagonospora nodorum]KAH4382195.1 hypothetical protein HBH97_082230 [Parastagonospora nodorum]
MALNGSITRRRWCLFRSRRQARGNWVFVTPAISTHVRLVVGEVGRGLMTTCDYFGSVYCSTFLSRAVGVRRVLIVEGDIRWTTKRNAQGKGETTWSQIGEPCTPLTSSQTCKTLARP